VITPGIAAEKLTSPNPLFTQVRELYTPAARCQAYSRYNRRKTPGFQKRLLFPRGAELYTPRAGCQALRCGFMENAADLLPTPAQPAEVSWALAQGLRRRLSYWAWN